MIIFIPNHRVYTMEQPFAIKINTVHYAFVGNFENVKCQKVCVCVCVWWETVAVDRYFLRMNKKRGYCDNEK